MTTGHDTSARAVGASVHRKEDRRLLTGAGRYVDDVAIPGLLHAAFVRSVVAKATITRVDTSAAEALPGVIAVFVATDLDPHHRPEWHRMIGKLSTVPPPLAGEDVRFVGDPIALVVATSRYVAEDACELVDVDLEPEAPCVDFRTAAADTGRVVHARTGSESNVLVHTPFTSLPEDGPPVDDVIANAAHVVEATISQNRYLAVPMETRGLAASWSDDGTELDIVCSSQAVHETRYFFSQYLEIDAEQIRIEARDVGGGFGQKIFAFREECAVVLAARLLGRPVKWIEDRHENLVAATHSRNESGRFRLALDDDLRFLAIAAVEHVADCGAYPSGPGGMNARLLPGPYRTPHLGFSSDLVWTNTSGKGPYRGPWLFETTAREMMIDRAARAVGVDPIELRRKNLLSAEDLPFTNPGGFEFRDVTPLEALERALEMLGFDEFRAAQAAARREGRLLGLGCSVYIEPSATDRSPLIVDAATVRIDAHGNVVAYVGTSSTGNSVETTMAQIVADALGVAYEDVTVVQGQTEDTPYGAGTAGSRTAVMSGGAMHRAGDAVRDKVGAIAAHLLEADPADIVLEQGRAFVAGTPSKAVTIAEVAAVAHGAPEGLPPDVEPGLEETRDFRPSASPTWSNAAHLCVVEVDPLTCRASVVRYIVAEDCGQMINPTVVDGQIAGGVVQGIGGVLLEDFVYDDDGNPLTTTFLDYLLPTTSDVPFIEIGHLGDPAPTNPGGYKGMGEGGAIGAHAATANAVADALAHLGVDVTATPLGPNDIHRLLLEAGRA